MSKQHDLMCDGCSNNHYEKTPSVDWPSNPCINCLYNVYMAKTNNFKPIDKPTSVA